MRRSKLLITGKFLAVACLGTAAILPVNADTTIDFIPDVRISTGEPVTIAVKVRNPDADVPELQLVNVPVGAAFSNNGDGNYSFAWLPDEKDIGNRTLKFKNVDFSAADQEVEQSVEVIVDAEFAAAPANLPPQLGSLFDQQVSIGESFDFRVVATDPENQVPGIRLDNAPRGTQLNDNGDGTRQFQWTPGRRDIGPNEITITAFDAVDSNLQSTRSITLTVIDDGGVSDGNLPPRFTSLTDQQVFLGETLEFRVKPVDDDGDVPGVYVDRMPSGAEFRDNGDGSRTFIWAPNPADAGDLFLTFVALDARDRDLTVRQTIRVVINGESGSPVNFPPVIEPVRNSLIRVGDTLMQRVKPSDPDSTTPALMLINQPSGSNLIDNGDGSRTFQWQASAADIGQTRFRFQASDADDPTLRVEESFTVRVVEPGSLDRTGDRLRVLADNRNFLIGFAATLESSLLPDNELYLDLAAEEFNIVTAENSHKMDWIQPSRGVFNWTDADNIANYAQANDMVLHGHPLVWHAQLPGWVQSLPPAEAREVMRTHITEIVSRYRGRIKIWDVVNEALEEDGSLRDSIWHKGMGANYIQEAFLAARAADPGVQLIYNDFDVSSSNVKSDAMYELVRRELAAGTPIDGVGFQMHLWGDFNAFGEVATNFKRFAELGLDIYITEFDVALRSNQNADQQQRIYRRVLELCLSEPRCRAMQSWGYTDRYSWRAGNTPLMLNDQYKAKAAYYAWQDTLSGFAP